MSNPRLPADTGLNHVRGSSLRLLPSEAKFEEGKINIYDIQTFSVSSLETLQLHRFNSLSKTEM